MLEAQHLLYPRLRPVEAFPVRMNQQDLVCLRDPENLADQPIFLNRVLSFLVSRMNGENSLRDIQADYLRTAGEILPIESLENVVSELDQHLYLDGPTFRNFYDQLVAEYKAAPVRPARHADSGYSSNPDELVSQINACFALPDGPGFEPQPHNSRPLRGLIAPHIDFTRGGPAYAHAYRALAGSPRADTYIIFGTCHMPMPQRFSVSDKDYETPLGAACTDRELVERLLSRIGWQYRDEIAHRAEHSIEFQTVFLRHIRRGGPDFKIVPILVGSFHDIYSTGETAADHTEITMVVEAIRECMAEARGQVCIIAGADLAHVGRRFGDSSGPTEFSLRGVERADLEFLKLVESGDAEAVFRSIAADNDSRRVCGYPPIYMMLRCLAGTSGKVLQYRQWADLEAGAAVTYASVALY